MIKQLLLSLAFVFIFAGFVQAADTQKILLCHATNSATNPDVLISVSANAVEAQLAQGSTIAIELPDGTYTCEDPGPVPQ